MGLRKEWKGRKKAKKRKTSVQVKNKSAQTEAR